MKKTLFYLELQAQSYIFAYYCFTEKGRVVFDESERFIISYFLEIYFFIFEDDLKAYSLRADNFEELSLFTFLFHSVPHGYGATFLKRPPYFFQQCDAISPMDVDIGIKVIVGWSLLLEKDVERVEINIEHIERGFLSL